MTGRRGPRTPVWPVWVLAAAAVFLAGFRVGLNVEAPRSMIDVGFAGVIGGQRIANGQVPYGHMPDQGDLKKCGPADATGRGARADPDERALRGVELERGDTYGPVSYLAYVPGYLAFGWTGKWDELWAAHATSLLFDGLCILGLALVGRRFGGNRLAATLAFAWAAYPFTLYASNSNTNDAIMPAFLIFGFWLASSPWARGAAVALAGWTKFAALLLAPLWLGYPNALRSPLRLGRSGWRWVAGFAVATLASFAILLLEPDPARTRPASSASARSASSSTASRRSRSGAGVSTTPRESPTCTSCSRRSRCCSSRARSRSRSSRGARSPLQLAALTAAVLIGFELVLTHWFYLYIPWFFPFVAFAVLSARDRVEPVH